MIGAREVGRGGRARLIVFTLVTVALSLVGTAAASPQSLYRGLLTSRYTGLPSAYYKATVGSDSLEKKDKLHHAVGSVLVNIDNSDAAVIYTVFPSRDDVAGRFRDPAERPTSFKEWQRMGTVPGFAKTRSRWINGTIEGKNVFGKTVRNGITAMYVQKANVIVGAITVSTDNEASGDVPGTIVLLRSGLAHLGRVVARTR
jgi:hypothetical protein